MPHVDWCGKKCIKCNEECELFERIGCLPDCKNIDVVTGEAKDKMKCTLSKCAYYCSKKEEKQIEPQPQEKDEINSIMFESVTKISNTIGYNLTEEQLRKVSNMTLESFVIPFLEDESNNKNGAEYIEMFTKKEDE